MTEKMHRWEPFTEEVGDGPFKWVKMGYRLVEQELPPRISCMSPARETAIQHYATAPIGELAIELMRLAGQPWHSRCTSCYRIALEIAAKRMLDFNGAESLTREEVLRALAQ